MWSRRTTAARPRRKVGTAPIQREGVEYEFDLFGELDQENTLVIHKSRCPALSGAVIPRPGPAVADTLCVWLSGAPISPGAPPLLRVQASVTPIPEPEREDPPAPVHADGHADGDGEDRRESSPRPSPQAAEPQQLRPTPASTAAPRKSLTERARELGYEGDAWMALVYRVTGKREPHELTGEDKTKLAVYLGRLAKLASVPSGSRREHMGGEMGATRRDARSTATGDDQESEERGEEPGNRLGA